MTPSSDETGPEAKARWRTWLWRGWVVCVLCLSLMWLIGQVVGDVSWLTWVFFSIPSAVVLVLLVFTGLLALWRRRWRLGITLALVAVVPAWLVGAVENRWGPVVGPEPGRPSLRLVHWNVCRGHLGWGGIAKELASRNADLYVISEFPDDVDVREAAAEIGPQYRGIAFGKLAAIARGSLTDGRWLARKDGLKVHAMTWRHDATDLTLFVVDIGASLFTRRDPRLRRLTALMQEHRPDLVVGDFNSRRRSGALCPLPDGFAHAYETAGTGWSYTWPVPFPVLAIDQCIIGERIVPIRYSLASTLRSDHRIQTLDFAVRAHATKPAQRR